MDNVVEASYIGTTSSGQAADTNAFGVSIAGGQGTQVRGNLTPSAEQVYRAPMHHRRPTHPASAGAASTWGR